MTCDDRCRKAKGDLCRCECGGANHGIDAYDPEEDNEVEIILTFDEAQPYWDQMNRHNKCSCGYEGIHGLEIYGYKHEAGWDIRDGFYWLWVRCPKCGYAWSLNKLGVSRGVYQADLIGYMEE